MRIQEHGLLVGLVVLLSVALGARAAEEPAAPVEAKAAEKAADEGQTHTNPVGMKLRLIPAGSFIMGSEADGDEQPLHKVTFSKPFYLGVTEVTQEQYEKVMGANPSKTKGASLPVGDVSWDDAQAFCKKLSQQDPSGTYRLPTEAEWEYACRAGTRTAYYWGEAFDPACAWVKENGDRKPHPVATRKPNAWGLHDMAGNAWEWCQDWHAKNYVPGEQTDPPGPAEGKTRIVRGGSWFMASTSARSANRHRREPERMEGDCSFRVVYLPKK